MTRDRVPRASRAIANPTGVTCYLGAALQAIAHAAPFVRALLTAPRVPSGKDDDDDDRAIAAALRSIVTAMWARSGDALDPSAVLRAIAPRLARQGAGSPSGQNDAHEALAAMSCALVELRPEAFRTTLEGRLRQVVRCEACDAETSREEAFTELPLHPAASASASASEAASTAALLDAFQAPERVVGYHCEKCGRRDATAARMVRFKALPGVLVLVIPTLRPVIPDDSIRFSRLEYRLVSIVCHAGSVSSGHYVTVARRPGSRTWDLYDDERVNEVGDRPPVRGGYMFVYAASSSS